MLQENTVFGLRCQFLKHGVDVPVTFWPARFIRGLDRVFDGFTTRHEDFEARFRQI